MLLENPAVLDRHLPAAEVDQLRAKLAMKMVERRAFGCRGSLGGRGHWREISTQALLSGAFS
jgi:hypothetical protein